MRLIEAARAATYDIHFLTNNVSSKKVDSSTDAVSLLAQQIIQIMLFVAGALAIIFTVYSGILYITSQGNPDTMKKAQNGLIYGAIGIAVIVIGYFAVSAVAYYVNGVAK